MVKKNIRTRSKLKKARSFLQEKQYEDACKLYEQICQIDTRDAESWYVLGGLYGRQGKHDEAFVRLQHSIELRPNHSKAQYNLGLALREKGEFEKAISALAKAYRLDPENTEAGDSLAHAYITLGQQDKAESVFKALLKNHPEQAETWSNLGTVYTAQGKISDAISCYREAQRLRQGEAFIFENLGAALSSLGNYDDAIACYKDGLKINPDNHRARSNYLLTLNYLQGMSRNEVLTEHKQWEAALNRHISLQPVSNTRDTERRLKIAYISPDMRTHSVSNFFEPLLAAHNSDQVETVCYSSIPCPDETTISLQNLAHQWRDISRMPDTEIIKMIRDDGIDILVDLAGHTACNHLTIFLYKPAPIQVTWLGYPNTTGLSTIDYRITDYMADPKEQDKYYTEKLYRLPECFLCYKAPESCPPVSPLPAIGTEYITFGSFNNLDKMNRSVIRLWSNILKEITNARLLLKNPALSEKENCKRILSWFAEDSIDLGRIELHGRVPCREEHLAFYSRIDIALDTFPYNGTTTTCEALWMGVPVITQIGDRHAGRVGLSLLSTMGLDAWVADSVEHYIDIAKELAININRLADLRAGLRQTMQSSRLCDGQDFAARMETAYRKMWQQWCKL